MKYRGWDIAATEGGGCLLIGTTFTQNLSKRHPFIMKISNIALRTHQLLEVFDHVITLFPNPSDGMLRIDIDGITDVDMSVYDMVGVCIYKVRTTRRNPYL